MTTTATDWYERTLTYADGSTGKCLERMIDPSTERVERIYPDGSPDRIGAATGTAELRGHTAARSTRSTRTSDVQSVYITKYASKSLRREPYDELVEHGGGAFGFMDGDTLVIDAFTGRAYDGGELSCRLDADYIVDFEAERQREIGLELVGTWHSHPTEHSRQMEPSPTDEKSWRSWAKCNRDRPFVGVIVSPFGSIHAHIDRGRFEQLPVTIEEWW